MQTLEYNNFLLKTAFVCMACDGDIDKNEIDLISALQKDNTFFGDIDIQTRLNELLAEININGQNFIKDYFDELSGSNFSDLEQLKLIEVAIKTIQADNKIEYSEIKFFKVIRMNLNINDDKILDVHPDFEDYLKRDVITDSYLQKLKNDYFNSSDIKVHDTFENVDIFIDNK